MTMTRIQKILGVVGVPCAAFLLVAAIAAPERYEASLSSLPYNDATRATLAGKGHAAVVLDGSKLSVTGIFSGLASAATDAHLMLGLAIGVPGPVALPLKITLAQEGSVTGDLSLDSAQVAAVRRGRMYIQINSKSAPTGNLWGWILPERPRVVQHEPVPGHGFLPQLDILAR
jgi:hypothetical protein